MKTWFIAPLFALVTLLAHAQEGRVGSLLVQHPHARATVPGQAVGAGYLTLRNQGRPDRLLGAEAAVSKKVELHAMSMDGDVMRMRQVEAVELPAGQSVEFKPGGYHLMFMDLKAPLKAGDSFPMTLRFEKAGALTVTVKGQALGAAVPAHPMKH